MKRLICSIGLSLFTMAGILIHSTQAGAVEGHQVFLKSAIESAGFKKVTLPIFEGRSHGEKIWFVVTDSSDRGNVNVRGVNFAPKLSNAKGTPAVFELGLAGQWRSEKYSARDTEKCRGGFVGLQSPVGCAHGHVDG